MDGSGGHHPEWGNPITKEHTWYALSGKWRLAQKLRIPKIQFAKHMKFKKKEDQSVDISSLLRMGNKRSYRDKVQSRAWRNDHPETAPLGNPPYKQPPNPVTRQMPTRACWQEPDTAVTCEALLVPGKYRSWSSQSSIGQSTRSPMKELEKYPVSWRGLQPHRKNINMN